MTSKEVINCLTRTLLEADLNAEQAASLDGAIKFIRTSFWNEDASREIDRLTVLVESCGETVELLEHRNEHCT